jgi:hypothetical protein
VHIARTGDNRNEDRILIVKPEGRKPPGIYRRKWEDNIKTNLGEIVLEGMDWIDLAQDRDSGGLL